MKLNLYSQSGEKLESAAELDPAVFGVEPNTALMAQYVRVYQSNQRQGTVGTKTRGNVRGGGKKPWRQKGTGKARHGSTRSPLWVGGGVVFGPQPRDWHLKLPRKMRRAALFSALSQKVKEDKFFIIDKVTLSEIKTKAMADILSKFCSGRRVLLVIPEVNENIVLSARNLPGVCTVLVRNLNAYEVLKAETVIFLQESLKCLKV